MHGYLNIKYTEISLNGIQKKMNFFYHSNIPGLFVEVT
jgi:hypothetical protein